LLGSARSKAVAIAACLAIALGAALWFAARHEGANDDAREPPAIAWLVNAQDCLWAEGAAPVEDLRAGKLLRLERGLGEVRFQCRAPVRLEGPAGLELISSRSARLVQGKLTARVATPNAGFEIVSVHGKVIDLGTEFGVSVSDTGATEVYVFEGK